MKYIKIQRTCSFKTSKVSKMRLLSGQRHCMTEAMADKLIKLKFATEFDELHTKPNRSQEWGEQSKDLGDLFKIADADTASLAVLAADKVGQRIRIVAASSMAFMDADATRHTVHSGEVCWLPADLAYEAIKDGDAQPHIAGPVKVQRRSGTVNLGMIDREYSMLELFAEDLPQAELAAQAYNRDRGAGAGASTGTRAAR